MKCHALPEPQARAQMAGWGQYEGHGNMMYPPLEIVCGDCHDTWNHEEDPGLPPYSPYFLWRSGGPGSPLTNACTSCHGSPHDGGAFAHPNDVFPYLDATPPMDAPLLPAPPPSVLPLFQWPGFPVQDPYSAGLVCTTCHDPHVPAYPVNGRSKFLRVGDYENSQPLCNTCHAWAPQTTGSSLFIPSDPDSVRFFVGPGGELRIDVTVRNGGNAQTFGAYGSVTWEPESGYPVQVGPLYIGELGPGAETVASTFWPAPPPEWAVGGRFRFEFYPPSPLLPSTPAVFIRGAALPPAPVNLRPTGATQHSIGLEWDLPPGAPPYLSWDVYRDGRKITPTPTYLTSYTDFGLAPETPHIYRVVSVLEGLASQPSDPVGETTAQGYVIRVPQDIPTIQEAIAAASAGTSIHVAPGTYADPIGLDGKNGITVKGQDANGCVLDYSGYLWGPPQVRLGFGGSGNTLSGFTVRNGTIEMDAGDVVTASVLVRDAAPE